LKGLGTLGKAVASTVAAGAVIAGSLAIGGVVSASGGGSSAQPSTATAQPVTRAHLGPLAGALHADMVWTLRDGSTKKTSADVGRVASIGNGSITIQRADGKSVTAAVGAATCIRNDGRPATLGDLKAGERAVILQGAEGTLAIRARDRNGTTTTPASANTPREGCHLFRGVVHGEITVLYRDGSSRHWTYDRGQITSITGAQISFKRADGASVTLRYDAATIVREKGQPESVKDLKVGERAMFFSQDGLAKLIRCVSKGDATAS